MPRASGLEAEIKQNFPQATVELSAGSNGIYDIKVDGRQIFSKHQSGRFPDNQEIIALLK
nr:Rdx family protein [Desulfurivibrio alkaliphilus]